MNQAAAVKKTNEKTAITPTRAEDFPAWYQAVIRAADMAENSPVRGCMTIKPYGYGLWENIQKYLDGMIKECGVQNAYFPLLIPLEFIGREAKHIDGFATECAVVTHHRLEKNENGDLVPAPDSKLTEPFVIRPTSETIIGDALSNWVQSYRDLPYKLNQWCNVMRWEMRPRMFLRTTEFLWQEGHNCFETAEESRADSLKMLDVYTNFIENYLAVPVVKGEKTPEERFPGAIATYTIEAMMQDGKALQAGTSHDLGQTFSKSMGITFQGRDGQQNHAWTTSWGMSTRTIGGLIMTHGDDDGMRMPPNIAPQQVVVIPVTKGGDADAAVLSACRGLAAKLKDKGVRVYVDERDERTPTKMWDAIKKGIPVRVEIGAREVDEGTLTYVRRDLGKDGKKSLPQAQFVAEIGMVLNEMQHAMLSEARARMNARIYDVASLGEIEQFFKDERQGFVRVDYDVVKDNETFNAMCKTYAISCRCLPVVDGGKKVLIGKSY